MAKAQETKTVAPKNAVTKVIENIKIENAFRRINVPTKAVVFVLEPGQVKSAEMETFLRSQGLEIVPVVDVTDTTPTDPREAAFKLFDQLKHYTPETQNQIFKALFIVLSTLRRKEADEAENECAQMAKRLDYLTTHKYDLLKFAETASNENGKEGLELKKF